MATPAGCGVAAQPGPGADDYGPVLFGRPPTDLGRGLLPRRALSSAFNAAAGPAQKVHDKAQQVKDTVQQDHTKLPFAVTHPTSVGAHHVASSSGVFMRTGIGLIIVVALIYGVYWMLKRYGNNKSGAGKSDGRMNVIATTALAQNRALHLVQVGDEIVLVGSSDQGVTPVRVYSADESAELKAQLDGEPPPLRPTDNYGGGWGGMVSGLRSKTVRK